MTTSPKLTAPFPYFGGKSKVSSLVWSRFGAVRNYVEPFFGSGAMLLGRPTPFAGTETVNDLDGLVANFWRAVKANPEAVAFHADNPVNENDLHSRHSWLVGVKDTLAPRLEGDPDWHDPKIAGWWVWGTCCWIGGGFCSGKGPWQTVEAEDGSRQLVRLGNAGMGVSRRLVYLGSAGMGVNRTRVHLGNAGMGVKRKLVHLSDAGRGVNRIRVHLGNAGMGEGRQPETGQGEAGVYAWMQALSDRLARVRVCSGDWKRVCTPTVTVKRGLTAVFLDPPYADTAKRTADIYTHDDLRVAHAVREWAVANGDDSRIRIALCGYEGEHVMPETWECVAWKSHGGYGNLAKGTHVNFRRERVWFSPHCLKVDA